MTTLMHTTKFSCFVMMDSFTRFLWSLWQTENCISDQNKALFFICCCYELTFRLCQNHSETFAEFQVTFNAYFKHKLTTYCVLFLALCTRNIIQTHLAREAPMYILPKQVNETLVFKSKIARIIEQCNLFSAILYNEVHLVVSKFCNCVFIVVLPPFWNFLP